MRYFQKFPQVAYNTTEIVNGLPQNFVRQVPNMTVRFDVTYDAAAYQWYTIQDRDRPDTLAAQWYGSSEFTWVVLLSNNMRDIYDWPMSSSEFASYMNKKYESSAGANNGIAQSLATIYQRFWIHPITNQNLIVDATAYALLSSTERTTISVFEYESNLNDERRKIKWLSNSAFDLFVQQFNKSITSGA